MKILKLVILLVLSSKAWSQSYTTINVGQAGLALEKMIILSYNCNAALDNKMVGTIRSDFVFYEDKIRVDLRSTNTSFSNNLKRLYSDGYSRLTEVNCANNKIDIYNTRSNSLIKSLPLLNHENTRTRAHLNADNIYQTLYGKKSLFTSKLTFSASGNTSLRKTKKELFICDFDGGNLKQLTNHGGIVLSPAFSPDNRRIIYSLIPPRSRDIVLYEHNLDTGLTRVILDKKGLIIGAVYTADGAGIYLTISNRSNADIYYMNVSTKALRRVTNHRSEDVDPAINKAGNLMSFLSGRAGRAMIYSMDPITGEPASRPKRISYVGKVNATPRFSPDGSEIVFSSWKDNTFDIFRFYANGQSLVRLTSNFGSNENPTFSPEGQFIAFSSKRVISRRQLDQNLYIMTRDGKNIRPITKNIGQCSSPRFSN